MKHIMIKLKKNGRYILQRVFFGISHVPKMCADETAGCQCPHEFASYITVSPTNSNEHWQPQFHLHTQPAIILPLESRGNRNVSLVKA